jgi:hypothetical protein
MTTESRQLCDHEKYGERLREAGKLHPTFKPDGTYHQQFVIEWKNPDRRQRSMPRARFLAIAEGDGSVEIHQGSGLTLDHVVDYIVEQDRMGKGYDDDDPGYDIGIWHEGRLLAVIDLNVKEPARVIRLDRDPATA